MSDLTVDIVTPIKTVFSGTVREARVPGALGEFGVLPEHTFFLSLLRPGVATLDTAGGAKRFVIGHGFAEASPDRVVILTDSCEDAETIDKAAAQEALTEAEAVLAGADPNSEEYRLAASKAELSRARLEA